MNIKLIIWKFLISISRRLKTIYEFLVTIRLSSSKSSDFTAISKALDFYCYRQLWLKPVRQNLPSCYIGWWLLGTVSATLKSDLTWNEFSALLQSLQSYLLGKTFRHWCETANAENDIIINWRAAHFLHYHGWQCRNSENYWLNL